MVSNLFCAYTLPRFVNEALAEQVQRIDTSGREQVSQWCFWELSDRDVVWQFCVALPGHKKSVRI
jgi:hypothetical protein